MTTNSNILFLQFKFTTFTNSKLYKNVIMRAVI